MGRKASANTTTSMLAFVNTISRSADSKNSGWTRSPCGLGGFAGLYVVRAVRLIELLPGIVTNSSNQGQTIWQNRIRTIEQPGNGRLDGSSLLARERRARQTVAV